MARTTSLEGVVFASEGDRVNPDDDTRPVADQLTMAGGNIDAQGPFSTHFNYVDHRQDAMINLIEQQGILEWSPLTSYSEGALCKVGRQLYQLADGGDGSVDPSTDGGLNWAEINFGDPSDFTITDRNSVSRTASEWASGQIYSYATLNDALADNSLKVGVYIQTSGYNTSLDGGHNRYLCVATGTGTDDGGRFIDHPNSPVQLKGIFPNGYWIEQFGATADDGSESIDSTDAINNAILFMSNGTRGKLQIGPGIFMASKLIIHDNVYIEGSGYDTTTLKQIAGSNTDFIESYDLVSNTLQRWGIERLEVDGNYFAAGSSWNSASPTLGNTSGGGIKVRSYGAIIDIGLNNTAGIGLRMVDVTGSIDRIGSSDYVNTISVSGVNFGKEGVVIEGPNDWFLKRVYIGRAGILPRPDAETTFATSDLYSGEPVDGLVIDGANVEIGDEVHVYACWSGGGFQTRNSCRLTKGGRIISESNNFQARLSSQTYGSAFIDMRNLALLHPNWTATKPTYTFPDPRWDAVSCFSSNLELDLVINRTITSTSRVPGTAGFYMDGGSKVDVTYINSTVPSGYSDPDAGTYYSGKAIFLEGRGGQVTARCSQVNGDAISVESEGLRLDFSVTTCINGSALSRNSVSNSKRGNNITGAAYGCDVLITSQGTPTSEILSISGENCTTPFTGDRPDLNRGQIWNVSCTVAGADKSNKRFLLASLDASTTASQEVTVSHDFIYQPRAQEVLLSVSDPATPSTAYLEYLVVKELTSTDVTIGYKFATTDTSGAANQNAIIRIG